LGDEIELQRSSVHVLTADSARLDKQSRHWMLFHRYFSESTNIAVHRM